MRRLGRVHEQCRRACGCESGGDLAGDMARLAHAGNHEPPGQRHQKVDRLAEAALQTGGQRKQPCGFRVQHVPGHLEIGGGEQAMLGQGDLVTQG